MAITIDDFSKIWASTSPLTPYIFSESNYKEGWNFVGATPPSRQMWDFLQKNNDEKSKFLLDKFGEYLPLSGGTMSGAIEGNPLTLTADDGNGNSADLVLNADGSATLDGNNVITSALTGNIISVGGSVNLPAETTRELCRVTVPADGTYLVIGYSDLQGHVNGLCYVMLDSDDPDAYIYRVVRYNGTAGGGDNAVNLSNLRAGYHVILKGFCADAMTMRGNIKMVRLA